MKTKRHYRSWSDKDLKEAVQSSISVAQVLRKLGLRPTGGNYRSMETNFAKYQLDTKHFTGQRWSKGLFLKEIEDYSRPYCSKRKLLSIRGYQCEVCKRKTWNKKQISIELHHIDGNPRNGKLENLQLICPNCHSQTDNYKNTKRRL